MLALLAPVLAAAAPCSAVAELMLAELMLAAADSQDSNAAVLLPLDYYLAALPCLILDI